MKHLSKKARAVRRAVNMTKHITSQGSQPIAEAGEIKRTDSL